MSDDAKSRAERAAAEAAAAQAAAAEAVAKAERAAAAAAAASAAEEAAAAAAAAQEKANAAAEAAAAFEAEEAAASAPADEPPAPAPAAPVATAPSVPAPAPQPRTVYVEAPKAKGRGGLIAVLAILSALLLAVVATDVLWLTGIVKPPTFASDDQPAAIADDAEPVEVHLAPANAAGTGALVPESLSPVPPNPAVALEPAGAAISVPAEEAITTIAGDVPGTHGAWVGTCRTGPLIEALAADAATAQAFIGVFADPSFGWDIALPGVDAIGTLFDQTNSAALVRDTWVTEHAFENGVTTPRQVLLQKGTVVLVDRYGVPRLRCLTGNPLTQPETDGVAPVFTGIAWPDFAAEEVVAITPAASRMDAYEIAVPGVVGGELVRIQANACFIDASCPGPGPVREYLPTPADPGLPLPTSTQCSADNQNETSTSTRVFNNTAGPIYVYWISQPEFGCTASFERGIDPYSSGFGNLNLYIGGFFVVLDANGQQVATFEATEGNMVVIK